MSIGDDPFAEFARIYTEAQTLGMKNPGAMVLSTVSPEGQPSSRQVLLKGFGPEGFVFYTNLESRKASEIAANPKVSLNFYWRELGRQVIVHGGAVPVSDDEADAYFSSRDRGSRLGAWASRQSRPLASRARLVAEVAKVESRYVGREIPRPPFWSGFRVVPSYFEFWAEGRFRLHDRFAFRPEGDGWKATRLYP